MAVLKFGVSVLVAFRFRCLALRPAGDHCGDGQAVAKQLPLWLSPKGLHLLCKGIYNIVRGALSYSLRGSSYCMRGSTFLVLCLNFNAPAPVHCIAVVLLLLPMRYCCCCYCCLIGNCCKNSCFCCLHRMLDVAHETARNPQSIPGPAFSQWTGTHL